jgi:hypothetical protein
MEARQPCRRLLAPDRWRDARALVIVLRRWPAEPVRDVSLRTSRRLIPLLSGLFGYCPLYQVFGRKSLSQT